MTHLLVLHKVFYGQKKDIVVSYIYVRIINLKLQINCNNHNKTYTFIISSILPYKHNYIMG